MPLDALQLLQLATGALVVLCGVLLVLVVAARVRPRPAAPPPRQRRHPRDLRYVQGVRPRPAPVVVGVVVERPQRPALTPAPSSAEPR